MLANARLVVQMTRDEKRALEARARMAGVSTAEFVRRRVSSDELDDYRAEIEALLQAIESSGPAILQSLDNAIVTANRAVEAVDKAMMGGRE
jgi:hypothetical protein